MPGSRLVLTLLERAESYGVREEIVGDLLEEIARGRSRCWICCQLLALSGSMTIDRLRRARVTPPGVSLVLSIFFMVGLRVSSAARVLEVWLVLYYVSGMLSLFAHMMSGTRLPKDRRNYLEDVGV